jgi:hypothetical protein
LIAVLRQQPNRYLIRFAICHDKLYAEGEAFHNNLYQEQARQIVAIHDEESLAKGLYDIHCVSVLTSDNPRFKMTPWSIDQNIAKKTLEATTQGAVRKVANPMNGVGR